VHIVGLVIRNNRDARSPEYQKKRFNIKKLITFSLPLAQNKLAE